MAKSDTTTRVAERSVESSASAVEWGAIFAGGVAAIGITAILFTLGPGLGLTTVSPWSLRNPSPTTFGTAAAIWMIVTQWLASAFGGYLTGRLRTKWVGIRTDEILFRDTAHGLLAWALGTVIMAALVTLGSAATAGVVAAAADAAPSSGHRRSSGTSPQSGDRVFSCNFSFPSHWSFRGSGRWSPRRLSSR